MLVCAAAGQTTVERLFTSGEDTLGNRIEYPDSDAAEITGARLKMMPGASTGWHSHRAPASFYVLAGELTVEYANGASRIFRAGDSGIEAQHVAHNGHNFGDEAVEAVVFYASARGVPLSEPEDPPRPPEFVRLSDLIPTIRVELRYAGNDNFLGRPVAGYESEVAYLTRPAADALRQAQLELMSEGLGLKVFDGYRPQRAVDDFMKWAADADDTAMKAAYYPKLEKDALVPGGYIAERSGHSRGSTVDVTLITLADGAELDMGSRWDFFDPISWPSSRAVSQAARENRLRLRQVMLRHGFQPLQEEWWHFTLGDEPFPDTYFDFPIQ